MMTPLKGNIMGAFGDRLRREREMRGITLDEISASTRIMRRHLEALEREEFDTLPGGIFNKGFVRAYARFLGIDEEQAVADYLAANSPAPQTEEAFPLEFPDKHDSAKSARSVTLVMLGLLVLGGMAGGWFYWTKYRPKHQAKSAPAPQISYTQSVPVPQQTPPPASAGAPSEVPEAQTPQAQVPGQGQSADGSFTVNVRVNEKSWVSMKADGRTVVERELSVGEEQSAKAEKQITLTVGNAAGVEVSFNGAPQGLLGEKGKVRTVTFTPHGREIISSVPETGPRLQ
jgi:cytoskeletal protein RodZ